MTADVVPPWIDLNVRIVINAKNRYTHAHDFSDGMMSYNGMKLTEAQVRQYFAGIGSGVVSTKTFSRDRTKMKVVLTLFSTMLWIDAKRLREQIDIDLRKHAHTK